MPGLRITTWNVNGIRNPFGYHPWRDKRTFESMFDILEADIVLMQELKIQRKDLRDDMVLVPGWDCFFSLPRQKKGYSGVGIYTRNSACAPIRAEEGLLGVLCPPNSTTPYCDLPSDLHIGGYLTEEQLAGLEVDAAALDAEGRCVVLEFPAFVLFGIYSPANTSGMRDDFRYGFLSALDTRVRNLIRQGKRVVVCGDLNVSREELDTAKAEENMKKEGITHEEYMSTPNRRILNQLLEGGSVFGDRDEGRERPVMWDVCRGFHPERKGMYTHWEQKINARPGNFGSRIDFVLCSLTMKSWFCGSNIQEGLMGSDHCPVYAIMPDLVNIDGARRHIKDLMNPCGTFQDGDRIREYESRSSPAFSAKLLPEFTKRQNIKDMFSRKPTLRPTASAIPADEPSNLVIKSSQTETDHRNAGASFAAQADTGTSAISSQATISSKATTSPVGSPKRKRPASDTSVATSLKRQKSSSNTPAVSNANKGQQSLKGFFRSTAPDSDKTTKSEAHESTKGQGEGSIAGKCKSLWCIPVSIAKDDSPALSPNREELTPSTMPQRLEKAKSSIEQPPEPPPPPDAPSESPASSQDVVDPTVSKESWSKLFTKPCAPRCESHDEPCKMMKTKKTGFNCGREFWMCARPLGPSGNKEKNTQWRCGTFIWSSDWNSAKI